MNIYSRIEEALKAIKYEQEPDKRNFLVTNRDTLKKAVSGIQLMLVRHNELGLLEVINYQRLIQELLNNSLASATLSGGNVEAIAYSGQKGYIYGSKQTSKFFEIDQINAIINGNLPRTTWNDGNGGEGIQLLFLNSDAVVLDVKRKIVASVNSLDLYSLNKERM